MSEKCYKAANARCPFYKEQIRQKNGTMYIKCENLFKKGRPVMLFSNVQKGDKWLNDFCNSINGCRNCEMYKLIIKEKYGYMVLYIITIPHFFYYSSQSYIFPNTTIILG